MRDPFRAPPGAISVVERMAFPEGPQITDVNGAAPLDGNMRVPADGIEPRYEQYLQPLQPFARLTRGQPLGKKQIVSYISGQDNATNPQGAMVSILTIGGQDGCDLDACQLSVTLSQPRAIKQEVTGGGIGEFNQQNITGSYENAMIGTGNFPEGNGTPLQWVPIIAKIEWGLGGATHVAYVDYVQGTTINLTASWVRVHALVAPDAQVNQPGTTCFYEVAANVGPGWPKPGNAQLTVFLGAVTANLESGVFAVPPFAKSVEIVSQDNTVVTSAPPALTAGYIRFWQGSTGAAFGNNVGNYYQAGNVAFDFRVPNGGAYFSVQSGIDITTKWAAIFTLAV
jgi:hypothetical protein